MRIRPRLKRSSTELCLRGSSASISLELIFNSPVSATVSSDLRRANMIPRETMLMWWLHASMRCHSLAWRHCADGQYRVQRSSDRWYGSKCRSPKSRARVFARRCSWKLNGSIENNATLGMLKAETLLEVTGWHSAWPRVYVTCDKWWPGTGWRYNTYGWAWAFCWSSLWLLRHFPGNFLKTFFPRWSVIP